MENAINKSIKKNIKKIEQPLTLKTRKHSYTSTDDEFNNNSNLFQIPTKNYF